MIAIHSWAAINSFDIGHPNTHLVQTGQSSLCSTTRTNQSEVSSRSHSQTFRNEPFNHLGSRRCLRANSGAGRRCHCRERTDQSSSNSTQVDRSQQATTTATSAVVCMLIESASSDLCDAENRTTELGKTSPPHSPVEAQPIRVKSRRLPTQPRS